MGAVKWIAIWGVVSTLTAIVAGILASARNRDHSAWAAWCFIFPPALLLLAVLPRFQGVRQRRPTLDEEDRLGA